MDLSYLKITDLRLQELRDLENSTGKEARREIRRRKMVHYCDGTAIIKIDDKAYLDEDLAPVEDVVEEPEQI
jgi:hypothetical protein|tara:strand:- start:439 stop:654 length:216 start_codon:yes stop_codon:yes gene_type:complete